MKEATPAPPSAACWGDDAAGTAAERYHDPTTSPRCCLGATRHVVPLVQAESFAVSCDEAPDEVNESIAISASSSISPTVSQILREVEAEPSVEANSPRMVQAEAEPEVQCRVAMSSNTFNALRAMALRETYQLDEHLGKVWGGSGRVWVWEGRSGKSRSLSLVHSGGAGEET